ncbi:hypothetical protein SAMN05428989_3576 [Pseudoxanthomonas sp. GM95]|uniref:hypothetical protein n=1 Tax=Pseudoxanthomonas sp. GM95 TaxID=1881043 RepID=UPI0008C2C6D5|nr:hypothetical protein [Pseudoxanthomonas sp. GM95]SEM27072.1 hypothetical protein SAMN05428989_3576 [Pseudoxanthomonas sp. GM95]
MKTRMLFALLLPLLAACATHPDARLGNADTIAPRQAIERAADAAPKVVTGTFAMPVRATGMQHGITFLNSEADYRDQRNLTIAITPMAAQALEDRFDAPLSKALVGKDIVVKGAARRVKIYFIDDDGKATDKYYYQTHVQVTAADQLQLATAHS